ncbi:3-keto-disaccharide hydrolase [Horticoccus sp. 23ND18S-11]|uniref:3-keto-disaccharide hydrolase n=1 Tax=Horticoccus sp. 23ND18S-11 TaxID=3391832 RepID=UPI0039C8D63B
MNPRPFLACIALVAGAFSAHAAENTLTAAEKSAGWTLLFDGKTMNGWRTYANKPAGGWEVKDGTLHAIAKVKGSELITEKKFNDYELAWEWKVPPAGNNGIKYFVTEARTKSPGPEYQMIDDAGHPDAQKGGALHQTASFYDVLPPAADKPLKKAGEWNQSRIVVRGKNVEHWLNGKNVLTYNLDSAEVKAGIAKSKFKNEAGFGDKIEGHIMLTYHQDDCWYRNIKIREIK